MPGTFVLIAAWFCSSVGNAMPSMTVRSGSAKGARWVLIRVDFSLVTGNEVFALLLAGADEVEERAWDWNER